MPVGIDIQEDSGWRLRVSTVSPPAAAPARGPVSSCRPDFRSFETETYRRVPSVTTGSRLLRAVGGDLVAAPMTCGAGLGADSHQAAPPAITTPTVATPARIHRRPGRVRDRETVAEGPRRSNGRSRPSGGHFRVSPPLSQLLLQRLQVVAEILRGLVTLLGILGEGAPDDPCEFARQLRPEIRDERRSP